MTSRGSLHRNELERNEKNWEDSLKGKAKSKGTGQFGISEGGEAKRKEKNHETNGIWLYLRRGKLYISKKHHSEAAKRQETGTARW